MAGLFEDVRLVVAAAAAGQGCDGGQQALIVPRLVDSVLRPLASWLGLAARGRRRPRSGRSTGPTRPARPAGPGHGGDAGGLPRWSSPGCR